MLALAMPFEEEMTCPPVTELVRDHALNVLGAGGGLAQARMDIDRLAAGDEGVDRWIAHQHNFDVAGCKPRRLDQRRGQVVEQGFGLGIAQHRLRRRRLRDQRKGGEDREETSESAHGR